MSIIGERIADARKSKNLTQKELGDLVDVSESTIARFEKNIREPRVSTLLSLAKVLDVHYEYLMGISDKTNLSNNDIKKDIIRLLNKL